MQRTIASEAQVPGVGLHTGCEVNVLLNPAPVGTGIVFRRSDLRYFEIEAQRRWVSRVVLATTLMKQGVMLSTVEHLLSAIYGMNLTNLYIDLDSLEVPILDGSAASWVELIQQTGTVDQDEEAEILVIDRIIRLEEPGKFIMIEPYHCFRVSYEIDFSHPAIGYQTLDLEINPENYASEISFARTFGFFNEVEELLKKGLIRGGSTENAVVLDDNGVMNGKLRCPDEFVRHKVLDLIGDISLCGYPLAGHITASRAGHSLHTNLATEIARQRSEMKTARESELSAFSPAAGF
jgi:UDP-3-O-[3-hydroxymyristoyl] N-acetylglucosamine deacetylase